MPLGPLGDVGPCQLWWGDTPAAIASVQDGATFRYSMSVADVKEAEHGMCAVDGVFQGCDAVEFEAPFTRVTYANLTSLIPGASNSGGESGNIQVFNNRVGTTMYSSAYELIVKRIVNGVVDTSQQYWLHFPKAYPIPQFDVPYTLDGQRGFMVLFKVFPVTATKLLWHIGDITA